MIQLQVRIYATLRRYQPQLRLGETLFLSLPEGSSVAQLEARLGIPEGEIKTVFVKGIIVKEDHVLSDGDEVGIFPPIAGG